MKNISEVINNHIELFLELDSNNLRPLAFAIYSKNDLITKFIIQSLNNEDHKDILFLQGALHQATRMQDLQTMQYLLEIGIPVDSVDEAGFTALNYAVNDKKEPFRRSINVMVSKLLLNNGANPLYRNRIKNSFNFGTILHSVCNAGDEKLLLLIIDKLKNNNSLSEINNASRNGLYTPLMLATSNNYLEIMKILLDNGADPDIKSFTGKSSLHLCSSKDSFNLLSKYSKFDESQLKKIFSNLIIETT